MDKGVQAPVEDAPVSAMDTCEFHLGASQACHSVRHRGVDRRGAFRYSGGEQSHGTGECGG